MNTAKPFCGGVAIQYHRNDPALPHPNQVHLFTDMHRMAGEFFEREYWRK